MLRLCVPVVLVITFYGIISSAAPGGFKTRIVGGENGTIEQVPYLVSLMYFQVHLCGASLISENTVITAAHCTFGLTTKRLSVRGGSSFRSSGGQIIGAKKVVNHPHFNIGTLDMDVSVVRLQSSFILPNIKTIKMASLYAPVITGTMATISGWGRLARLGDMPEIVQITTVPIWDHQNCADLYQKYVTDNEICAGYKKGGRDACQDDSGGPLVINNILYGIVSYGKGCADPNAPGVYSSIPQLRNDIDDMIKKLN